jgi:hypothetical protein
VSPRPQRELPYAFIVGCPRSDTTLLQRIFDHHPKLAVANDTHFIAKVGVPSWSTVRARNARLPHRQTAAGTRPVREEGLACTRLA